MKLKLFDSLQNKTTSLDLFSSDTLAVYLCGPTVYDYIHIGNLRSLVVFDVFNRLVTYWGWKLNYVVNITDIDDKIITKAEEQGRSEKEVAEFYTAAFLDDLRRFNVRLPHTLPRVTAYLEQIKSFIQRLLDLKFAYQEKDGDVLFATKRLPQYGALSGQKTTALRSGTRRLNSLAPLPETAKKDVSSDFVLWKKTTRGIKWDSPWGAGRPGWHSECVVFVEELFSRKTITIHGGGIDLKFPHHENERAQFLAANSRELSQIWLHVAHVFLGEEKMSKSLGNVFYAKDFAKQYDPDVLRLIFLTTGYNQTIKISEDLIKQNLLYLEKLHTLARRIKLHLFLHKLSFPFPQPPRLSAFRTSFSKRLGQDLDTAGSFFYLEKLISYLNKAIDTQQKGKLWLRAVADYYWALGEIMGLNVVYQPYPPAIKKLLSEWISARQEKNYSLADECRRKLQELKVLP